MGDECGDLVPSFTSVFLRLTVVIINLLTDGITELPLNRNPVDIWCPRQDSNLRTRFRKPKSTAFCVTFDHV